MEEFLQTQNLLRLNQKKIENPYRSVISKEIQSVIKNLPTNKMTVPDGFTGQLYHTFKEKQTPVLLKFFQKMEEKGILPN